MSLNDLRDYIAWLQEESPERAETLSGLDGALVASTIHREDVEEWST